MSIVDDFNLFVIQAWRWSGCASSKPSPSAGSLEHQGNTRENMLDFRAKFFILYFLESLGNPSLVHGAYIRCYLRSEIGNSICIKHFFYIDSSRKFERNQL